MIDLEKPEWRCNVTTGFLGAGFHLARGYGLVFLSGDVPSRELDATSKIGFIIMRNRLRDLDAEAYLMSDQGKFGKIASEPFGPGRLLTIAHGDLQDLYEFAKRAFRKAQVA